MYKVMIFMNNLVPSFFVDMFTVNRATHNYNTRQKNNTHVPSYRITVREHSVSVCGVKMWNDIPEELKELSTSNQFMLKCKRYCQNNSSWILFIYFKTVVVVTFLFYYIYILYFIIFLLCFPIFLLILYAGVYVTLCNLK